MTHVLGIPAGVLTVTLVALLGAAGVLLAVVGTRNAVFVRLGVRNIGRRKGRTALIVVGLMLATTIIATALGTGDTMAATVRSSVYDSLGGTDELVSVKGSDVANLYTQGASTAADYYSAGAVDWFAAAAKQHPDLIDGVAGAVVDDVAVQDETQRSTEPRVTVFGADALPAAFGAITGSDGNAVDIGSVAPGSVLLNRDAADALGARPGDRLKVLANGAVRDLQVQDVVTFQGGGTASSGMLLPLAAAQALLGVPSQIRYVLVSNAGGPTEGVAHTEAVRDALLPTATALGLQVNPTKQDLLDTADQTGSTFMQMFTTFGSFSIVAGIVLIFLIFVMLAAERRGEMGVARAIGTQRRHLVISFVFEGVSYDVVAAAVGAALGLVVSLLMVVAVGRLFAGSGFDVVLSVRPQTFVLAYAIGVLLTLAVVAASSWRVSRLNIVTAIRNLPDPIVAKHSRAHLLMPIGLFAVAALLVIAGRSAHSAMPFLLGVSLAIVGLLPALRLLGVSERVAYTVPGALLVVWWLLPFSAYDALNPDATMDFSVWIVGGLLLVLGAVWVVINNADLLLGAGAKLFDRAPSLTPVLRTAMAYPLRNRLRTGMTLGLFTLVVFTLVVGATTSRAFIDGFDDVDQFGGGFTVRASVSPLAPVADLPATAAAMPGAPANAIEAVGAQSTLAVKVAQTGTGRAPADYVLHGLDPAFLSSTTYGFAAMAQGYGSAADIWKALAADPTLAVVDSTVVPRRQNWGFGAAPEFALSGFWLDDGTFAATPIDVLEPHSGTNLHLKVIGVLTSGVPLTMFGVTTSQAAVAGFGPLANPTSYYLRLAPGVDATAYAKQLESTFLANGMQADAFADLLDDAVGASLTFNWLILGFMGLGLIVGIAALGVISARSVVERRQQIGVLRAIGFQPGMVQLGFLLEAAFVALTSIVLGCALGLAMAYNVITDAGTKPDWASVEFQLPWTILVTVTVGVAAAALLTTFLPARRASRVTPAEALRYQ